MPYMLPMKTGDIVTAAPLQIVLYQGETRKTQRAEILRSILSTGRTTVPAGSFGNEKNLTSLIR